MTRNKVKVGAIAIIAIMMFAVLAFRPNNVAAGSRTPDDAAATYKAKCAACHTATASKFYDPAKPDEEQIDAILKGKKGEKPPYMPAFEAKGITADQAKELVEYMKGLRKAGS